MKHSLIYPLTKANMKFQEFNKTSKFNEEIRRLNWKEFKQFTIETITLKWFVKQNLTFINKTLILNQHFSNVYIFYTYIDEKVDYIELNRSSEKRALRSNPRAPFAFKNLMIHWILQFALHIAFRCVLHRCENLDIHC